MKLEVRVMAMGCNAQSCWMIRVRVRVRGRGRVRVRAKARAGARARARARLRVVAGPYDLHHRHDVVIHRQLAVLASTTQHYISAMGASKARVLQCHSRLQVQIDCHIAIRNTALVCQNNSHWRVHQFHFGMLVQLVRPSLASAVIRAHHVQLGLVVELVFGTKVRKAKGQ